MEWNSKPQNSVLQYPPSEWKWFILKYRKNWIEWIYSVNLDHIKNTLLNWFFRGLPLPSWEIDKVVFTMTFVVVNCSGIQTNHGTLVTQINSNIKWYSYRSMKSKFIWCYALLCIDQLLFWYTIHETQIFKHACWLVHTTSAPVLLVNSGVPVNQMTRTIMDLVTFL